MRFLNTLLLFVGGVALGFIIKERLSPAAPIVQSAYRPDLRAPDSGAAPETDSGAPANRDAALAADGAAADAERPVMTDQEEAPEDAKDPAGTPVLEPVAPGQQMLKDSPENFFAAPRTYEDRELLFEMQMISARRTADGWRLNLVRTGPGKKVDYLYLDDDGEIGAKPDLRIGYSYAVRFLCTAGDPKAGNKLLSIEPTGGKADWATGLSAVE